MAVRRTGSRSARTHVDCDLELRPLMNVFIVLIPMLLMSAVFMEIRVIEMSAPSSASAASAQPEPRSLHLALHVRGDSYVVTGEGIAPVAFARDAAARNGALDGATGRRMTALLEQLATAHPDDHEIRIVAEARTHYQEIVTLMDLARTAGLSDAALEGSMEDA